MKLFFQISTGVGNNEFLADSCNESGKILVILKCKTEYMCRYVSSEHYDFLFVPHLFQLEIYHTS